MNKLLILCLVSLPLFATDVVWEHSDEVSDIEEKSAMESYLNKFPQKEAIYKAKVAVIEGEQKQKNIENQHKKDLYTANRLEKERKKNQKNFIISSRLLIPVSKESESATRIPNTSDEVLSGMYHIVFKKL